MPFELPIPRQLEGATFLFFHKFLNLDASNLNSSEIKVAGHKFQPYFEYLLSQTIMRNKHVDKKIRKKMRKSILETQKKLKLHQQ